MPTCSLRVCGCFWAIMEELIAPAEPSLKPKIFTIPLGKNLPISRIDDKTSKYIIICKFIWKYWGIRSHCFQNLLLDILITQIHFPFCLKLLFLLHAIGRFLTLLTASLCLHQNRYIFQSEWQWPQANSSASAHLRNNWTFPGSTSEDCLLFWWQLLLPQP